MNRRDSHSYSASDGGPSPRLSGMGADQAQPLRTLDSVTLFRGAHEIGIEHQGALYRLKITRQGKLILNK